MQKIIFSTIALLFTMSANAATFDFAGYADGLVTDGNGTSFSEGVFSTAMEDGITVTASGSYNNFGSWSAGHPYLDAGGAGLGLCKTTNCAGSNDDNVNDGEKLVLDFGQNVSLGNTSFRNKDHGTFFNGSIDLFVDGAFKASLNLASLLDLSGYKGRVFEFYNLTGDTNVDDFYINSINVSAVPVPAALWLFAPALIGFLGLRRRKNVVTAVTA